MVKRYLTRPLTHQAIKKINYKFDLTGSVLDLPGRGRKRSARSVDNVSRVKVVFDKSLKKSSAKASIELNISKTSVLRILV